MATTKKHSEAMADSINGNRNLEASIFGQINEVGKSMSHDHAQNIAAIARLEVESNALRQQDKERADELADVKSKLNQAQNSLENEARDKRDLLAQLAQLKDERETMKKSLREEKELEKVEAVREADSLLHETFAQKLEHLKAEQTRELEKMRLRHDNALNDDRLRFEQNLQAAAAKHAASLALANTSVKTAEI